MAAGIDPPQPQPTPPHVAVLFEFPSLNGGERSMLSVIDQLQSSGQIRLSGISPSAGPLAEQLQQRGLVTCDFDCRDEAGRRPPRAALLNQLRSICMALQPDLLHANSLSMARLTGALQATISAQSPVDSSRRQMACSGHLRDIIGLKAAAIADLNQNARLIAVSAATRDFHVRQGLQADRCTVIHNGVDTTLFTPRERSQQRRQVLPNIPDSARVLLTVGQICLRKAHHDIAEAVLQLLQSDPLSAVHWVVAGARYSGKPESVAYEQSLQQMFAAAGFASRLHLLGSREDVPLLMNAADLLVHAPRQEPFGRVLLEAAASGLPIIATHVGGTSEMLRDGQEAVLVEPRNPQALAAAVCRCLQDPQWCQSLASRACETVRTRLTCDQAARQTATFWKSCIDFHRHGRDSTSGKNCR